MLAHHSRMLSRFLPIVSLVVLAGCVAPSGEPRQPVRPNSVAVAVDAETKACVVDLGRMQARFTLLPDQNQGAGCSAIGSVMLTGAGVPISNVKAIRCPLARTLTQWVQGPVQQSARDEFGARVVRIESMGAYSCRNIIGGRGTGRSEHATANAIDIAAFHLSDGRRVSVEAGWNGAEDERRFLRSIRAAACKRFQTVLSPDYNAAHYNHLHFDMGRGPFCR